MDDRGQEATCDRKVFLRRSGALGVASAVTLGVSLLGTRASSATIHPPRDVIAPIGGTTIKIGYIADLSGVYAAAAQAQLHGLEVARDEASRAGSRVKWEIVRGDDANSAATAATEARRLISQEKVDVLTGCLSAAVGINVSAIASEQNTFFLAMGVHDTSITGSNAHRVTFRQTCSTAMLANAVGPELLKHGKKWYFLVADSVFGADAYARLKKILLAHGGTEVGHDLHDIMQTDYSSYLAGARLMNADVLVFCNDGANVQNATKYSVQAGLHKKMTIGGILCDEEVASGMPVDDLVGSVWGYVWGPDAGGDAMRVYKALKPGTDHVGWRAYLGYEAGRNIVNRILSAGTTDTETLVKAFENYHYDASKGAVAYFRACDHQAVQQTYAATIVPRSSRHSAAKFSRSSRKRIPTRPPDRAAILTAPPQQRPSRPRRSVRATVTRPFGSPDARFRSVSHPSPSVLGL